MCYKHRKEITFPSFFLILWTCIVVLAESSRLNSRKYLARPKPIVPGTSITHCETRFLAETLLSPLVKEEPAS